MLLMYVISTLMYSIFTEMTIENVPKFGVLYYVIMNFKMNSRVLCVKKDPGETNKVYCTSNTKLG